MSSIINAPNVDDIFNVGTESFDEMALTVFKFQWAANEIYGKYCKQLNATPDTVQSPTDIPFLPINFFKSHRVAAFNGDPEIIFTSSGTTGTSTSRHLVKHLSIYENAFTKGFYKFYGTPNNYALLCLLPSYLERDGSSLIYMAEELIRQTGHSQSGFFLKAEGELAAILKEREAAGKPSMLLGVTYALLDFAEQNPMPLQHTIIMETGGMKGRRRELTRVEVHERLTNAFGVSGIHSEYGMTELLSQAYSSGGGIFKCPPCMRVVVRDEDDPFAVKPTGAGLLCIIDLANIYSCSFIETADVGRVYADGSFEVLGRMDNSDIRGCSLLVM